MIKTLNTDKLSTKLTLERSQEKMIRKIIEEYASWFDYIFIDFPPSSNRLSEVLLDLSDAIIVVVGLDSLGLDGFFNTIQYFYDSDIDVDHIKYIVPNSFSKNRRAPKVSLNKLTARNRTCYIVLLAIKKRPFYEAVLLSFFYHFIIIACFMRLCKA